MFRFFKRKSAPADAAASVPAAAEAAAEAHAATGPAPAAASGEPQEPPLAAPDAAAAAAAAVVGREVEADAQADVELRVEQPPAGWFGRLRQGLRKTGAGISGLFGGTRVDEELFEELETALILADAGTSATSYLLDELRRRVRAARAETPQQVRELLRDLLAELLEPLQKPLDIGRARPTVIMMVGVNGAGKTTSIGKLTRHLQAADCKVLLAAGDTFRAAAREQLAAWGQRNEVQVIAQQGGDPAAVAFDSVQAGRARDVDVVIVDTAGRLPTQVHLMEELRKVKRVIGKAMDGAPHEAILVIDATNGQNALAQLRAFDDALGLSGIILTKLDGSAKGGVIAAIARERPVPIYFIGVGESLEDLQTFDARAFARALVD
ncbi:MAG: signal recognition particle-docking protein FtsY [Betaproteobacteria bacterium]|nr:signal recognition particle-docking protein FtsY [Betaproteobacteria bacterium]MBU6511426.1 signal recognition particle-docking protein FtsY [Betaproteobacteria bacterium]MDE2153129.1 signal recognition particle-docking protein FtsY [Betaproteobacteria bacterium]